MLANHGQYSKNVNDNNKTSHELNITTPLKFAESTQTFASVHYQNNNMSNQINENKSTIGGWKQHNLNQQNFYHPYDQHHMQSSFGQATAQF
jgi:hypothetical protein